MKLKQLVIDGVLSKFEAEQVARSLFGRKITKTHTKELSMPYELTLPVWDDLPEHVRGFVLKAILESDAELKMGLLDNDRSDD